jgi:hypothetical protein
LAQQEPARAEAIDQEAGRDLGGAGRDVEYRHQETERCVAGIQVFAQQRKQRRQREQVEMAHGMAGTNQCQDLHVAPHRWVRRSLESALWHGNRRAERAPGA